MNKYDIVIIGSGAAGMMAAWKAAKAGLKCVVLEKGKNLLASNASRCGGPSLADTKLQREANATVTVEQLFSHMYGFSRGTVHAALLHNALEKGSEVESVLLGAGITMTLLEDAYGVGFRARQMFITRPTERWQLLFDALKALNVEIRLQVQADHLMMDESGKVIGIRVTNLQVNDQNNQQVNTECQQEDIYADAVIVATGGYLGNEEMIKAHFGDIHVGQLGSKLSDGAGIQMVLEAGGMLDRNWGICSNEFGGYHSKMVKRRSSNLYFAIGGGLLVDRNGRRFMNEQYLSDEPLSLGGEMTLREGKYYAVLDDTYYHAVESQTLYDFYGRPEAWHAGKTTHDRKQPWKAEDLEKDIADGIAAKADTIEALAEEFGLSNLVQTVAEYNQMCADGKDSVFGKDSYLMKPLLKAPFYIFEYEPSAWCTIGGVKTDEYCRALTPASKPIEGLYVAGVDNGSCYTVPYYNNEGAAVGLAFTTGILAGGNAAEYVMKLNE